MTKRFFTRGLLRVAVLGAFVFAFGAASADASTGINGMDTAFTNATTVVQGFAVFAVLGILAAAIIEYFKERRMAVIVTEVIAAALIGTLAANAASGVKALGIAGAVFR